jgi:hypothetical protein
MGGQYQEGLFVVAECKRWSVRGGELMERPRPDAGCSSTDDFIN